MKNFAFPQYFAKKYDFSCETDWRESSGLIICERKSSHRAKNTKKPRIEVKTGEKKFAKPRINVIAD